MLVERRPGDTAIVRWLERSLQEQHAADLREPLPEALLKLLRDAP